MYSQDQEHSLPLKETQTQLSYTEFTMMKNTTISIQSEKMNSYTNNKLGMLSSNLQDFVQTFGFQDHNLFIEVIVLHVEIIFILQMEKFLNFSQNLIMVLTISKKSLVIFSEINYLKQFFLLKHSTPS